jgi:catechol 2,3-dioxygenase-like lactoylglutathione lyase family enzyme
MAFPSFVLFHVAEPLKSAGLYSRLFGLEPVQSSPNFVLFLLPNGLKFGLWERNDVQPPAKGEPGSEELIFQVASDEEVDTLFAQWTAEGLVVAQTPTRMDFGYTFVVLDPDGHRLRAYKLAA